MTEDQWSERIFADSAQNGEDPDDDEIAAIEKAEDNAEREDYDDAKWLEDMEDR